MALFTESDCRFAETLSRLVYCNPFLPERLKLQREALGANRPVPPVVWHKLTELDNNPDLERLEKRAREMAARTRQRLAEGAAASEAELLLYEDLVLYLLYSSNRAGLDALITPSPEPPATASPRQLWKRFVADFSRFLGMSGRTFPSGHEPARVFAGIFQIRRAFYHTFNFIVGASQPVSRLRAAVWESIFTHDIRRYIRRSLYDYLGDFPLLITGPSGTGKELVARAVGLSRFIPFNARKEQLDSDFAGSVAALNLSALAPTLIESELFGHERGAFTGAVKDRAGWLEVCPPLGTVFLDEIGELDSALQVKLLRVLQDRTFQRLGETRKRQFAGKIIAATNRDLASEMRAGRFREDLYYRLCGDMITTPSLQEQLADSPDDLHNLIRFVAKRIVPEEAGELANELATWIDRHLGRDYPWPGNFRELEQCVRNFLIRKEYHPACAPDRATTDDPRQALATAVAAGTLTMDELERRYSTLVYAQTRSYQDAAGRLKRNWRTVKSKIDRQLLQQIEAVTSRRLTH
jgi:transcriptional regulator with AAA-type ATPase domain